MSICSLKWQQAITSNVTTVTFYLYLANLDYCNPRYRIVKLWKVVCVSNRTVLFWNVYSVT
jgi:hypothetical protein